MPAATPPIPPLFLERMKNFLGDEFPAFAESLNAAPQAGLRVNTLKLTPEKFREIAPFALGEGVPWCPAAFALIPPALTPDLSTLTGTRPKGREASPGLHPYHLAGLYYLQDPSAMSPAELLNPQFGERVLDLAAAPGGKTTHLAALMRGEGLLVANEIKNKRVGHLAMNVERWGAGNVVITNESPERLADHFGSYFDRVLVDAPCSGEGMFRKDLGARVDWSPEMVNGCAARQKNILHVAAKLVRPGGYLLYSTCTFAPEEDEGVIAQLLEDFPGFEVLELPQFPGFMSGKPEWLNLTAEHAHLSWRAAPGENAEKNNKISADSAHSAVKGLNGAVRLFPHLIAGEGHFACLLRKKAGDETEHVGEDRLGRLSKQLAELWRRFATEGLSVNLAEDRLRVVGERLYFVPENLPDVSKIRFIHPGVWVGTFKKERFEPAHPFALFLKMEQARIVLNLAADSRELAAYLRGESLEVTGKPGWTLVTVDGWPLGWGKWVQGTLKNHFPRGWM
jgi:NOL1/NOP2/sun family putative RNA methylase